MLRAVLVSLFSRKLRLLLSGVAVALGVMAVSGALIVTETLNSSFDQLFRALNSDLDVQVTGEQPVRAEGETPAEAVTEPVPAGLVSRVGEVPGVERATGVVAAPTARVVGRDGKPIVNRGPPSFGISWAGEGGLVSLVELREGRGPDGPDEVAISSGLARTGDYGVGDRIDVLTLEPRRSFSVVGVFGYTGGRDTLGGETRIAFAEPVAQRLLLGRPGVYSSITVEGAEGVPRDRLRADVAAAVGPGYRVRTGDEVAADQASALTGFLDVVRQLLLGFSAVALVVGVFLILNTFSILVAQRTRELALYRMIGAGRAQVAGSVLVEAVIVGLLAATVGLVAGMGVAVLLRAVVQQQSGATLPGSALVVPPSAVVAAYLVGTLVTAAASLVPALRAARVAPVAAMRNEATGDRPVRGLTVAGVVLVVLGAAGVGAGIVADLGDRALPVLLVGVLVVVAGVALSMPAVTLPVVGALGRLFRSTPGRLGRQNSLRAPRRTAVTAAALMIGIALVTGVSVLAESLKASIEAEVSEGVDAELVISAGSAGFGGPSLAAYEASVVERAAALPGVETALAVWRDQVSDGSQVVSAAGADLPALSRVFGLRGAEGEVRPLGAGEVAVDDRFAADRGLSVGEQVELSTRRGERRAYRIVAVYERSDALGSPVVLSVADARTRFRLPQPSEGFLALADGADVGAVQREVSRLLADNPEVSVQDRSVFIDQQTDQVDTVVVLLYVLIGLAIVVAVLGVVNTLVLSVAERTRELGMLRAVGMRRTQVMRMIAAESVVISVFGGLLGLLVGLALGSAIVRALADRGVPELAVPWLGSLTFLVLAVGIGLVAAIGPAVRAARLDLLRAIAHE
jgi:putative ABC transport system permease protein